MLNFGRSNMSEKRKAKSIIKDNEEIITKAFKDTPMSEFTSFMRGINLGFVLCGKIIKSVGVGIEMSIPKKETKRH